MRNSKTGCHGLLCVGLVAALVAFAAAARADLVSWWAFEEGSGPTAHDSVGSNDGTLVNSPTWITSDPGRGNVMLFNGSSNYVNVPHDASIGADVQAAFTVAAWFKSNVDLSATVDTWRLLEKGDCYFLLQRGGSSDGNMSMGVLIKKGGVISQTGYGSTIAKGFWHQIVATYDGAALRAYFDGVLVSTKALSGLIDDDGLALHIGADDSGHYFSGYVDDVAIFNAALADGGVSVGQPAAAGSDVHTLYTQGPGAFVPEPATAALLALGFAQLIRRRRR